MISAAPKLLSLIVPVYNEAGGLPLFVDRVVPILEATGLGWEILFVNDGSKDASLAVMAGLQTQNPRVAYLNLSRNFGKEIAVTAGLDHARGDAVIVIDADLQDPPELIPAMIEAWQRGFDTVYAKRRARAADSWLKRLTARGFYRVMGRMSEVAIPANVGDYRLMSRRVVDAVRSLREHNRFMKGLFAWVGFPSCAVEYDRETRKEGHSKWNYWRLWNFALDGITSFSTVPLKFATYLGLATALIAVLFGGQLILRTLLFGNPVAGYPSLMAVVLFLGGVQLVTIGVIGEYLGRIFNETKHRPLYLVERFAPSGATVPTPAGAPPPAG
jgi:glycosyltransferase involved in cell wall biosynthesis